MDKKRPRSREQNNTGKGKGIFKREATGNGPVGSGNVFDEIKEAAKETATEVRSEVREAQEKVEHQVRQGFQQQNRPTQQGRPSQQNMTQEQFQQMMQQMQQQQMQMQMQQQMQQQEQHRPFGSAGAGQGTTNAGYYGGSSTRRGGSLLRTILILLILFVVAYFLLKSMGFLGTNNTGTAANPSSTSSETTNTSSGNSGSGSGNSGSSSSESAATANSGASASTVSALAAASGVSSGWSQTSNDGVISTEVAGGAREKFTTIRGDGTDEMAIYIYLCGTDLESKSAMATRDLQEMLAAKLSDKVNIVIMTGGCKNWQNDVMSSSVNEIYQISAQGLSRVSSNAGTAPMVDPDNLESFVKWASDNYPANRKALIFWDHGAGSVQGYGYDEKYPGQGSMTLDEIDTALSNAGVYFDFIGFDACLMATAETALVCSDYADYMIASEEVEPGIGWYYTTWLDAVSKDSSISTVDMAKVLIDDFTSQCARYCPGQETTLSIVDLAELAYTLPDKLAAFSDELSTMIEDGRYKTIAKARAGSHEFASSNKIDQVDLVHFAALLDTETGKELAQTVVDAVKYNRTAKTLNNAYGLSIYFPYRSVRSVDTMTATYKSIGISDSYTACIQKFAQMQVGGQASSGGSYDPFWTLLNGSGNGTWSSDYSGSTSTWGSSSGSGSGYGSDLSQQLMEELLTQLLGGRFTDFASLGINGLTAENSRFLTQNPMDASKAASYIHANILDPEDFVWQKNSEGNLAIILPEEKWELVNRVDMAMFYDDGEGYFDLGMDNLYDFDAEGNLVPVLDHSWVSIDDQPVAYYHMTTYDNSDDDYSIIGRVPVLLNGEMADLILVFDAENPNGYVAGFRYGYSNDVTETIAKTAEALTPGDKIDFVCDYYSYDGTFQDSYKIGEQYVVTDQASMVISNTELGDDVYITYRFTDIYGEDYWTPTIR